MPVVSITLLPGYAAETQHRLVNRLAQAVRSVIDTPEAGTTVFVNEVSTYRRDGKVFSEGRAAHRVASDVVRDYLQAMQSGDLALAQSHLSPDFRMCFPGAVLMHTLQDLTAWAAQRYSRIGKHYEQFEESWQGDVTVVFCHGTLHGTWLHGESFEGIRFIDRMEVRGGLITRQDVWNDLAEHRKA
ncbi:nuclear transport factor 2 family protein [Limnohabitans sp.]|jgi:phenylpyruvate tautomerase PptA (4-oxalocrotonate tautomerase family)|uniref:nuclear transport factor 2 family protein n=1 Tax=Limnohabitans sp. TaxID=1907725 RepID=UPI0039BCD867|nr:nuclear transport factor 2 family protein [Comamonadaceae bacterium]